jgi:hypothetical protein
MESFTVEAGGTHSYSSALKNYWSRSTRTSFQVQRNSPTVTQRTGELLPKRKHSSLCSNYSNSPLRRCLPFKPVYLHKL